MKVAGIVLALLLGLFMLTALQRQLIYFPEVAPEQALRETAARIGLTDWRNADNEFLGWRSLPTGDDARSVVVFHGNAGHALYRQYFVAGFLAQNPGWQVFLFEYPGYGARQGSPSEDGIKQAASEAVELLLDENPGGLYLLGESLGSGVATYLAGKFRDVVSGVLLITPFTSLVDVASKHYGLLPVNALLSERYDSQEALKDYDGPVAFLVAGRDEIVPATLGRQLYESYSGPKWYQEQPGAGHNTLNFDPTAAWWREVTDFWLSR